MSARRRVRPVAVAIGLAVLSSLAALALDPAPSLTTPAEYRRAPDQTFLTFPEWFLVHSPAEYARFLARTDRPSAFPLFAHIGQFWQSYRAVSHEIAKYPFNGGYHLMIVVIGSSTTVEYGLKGLYEHSIGRLAEATKSERQVPEERFAARYAQDYVDFIRARPWFEFDFWSPMRRLWSELPPLRGPDLIRRVERRYLLTTELLIKAGYARLIKLGTEVVYDEAKPTTAVVLEHAPPVDPTGHPDMKVLDADRPGMPALVLLPRYEAFKTYSAWLAGQGAQFVEVAGNRGEILVSLLTADDWQPAGGRQVFEQPILTEPGRKRVVMAVPIAQLSALLRRVANGQGVELEHVYDF